MIAEAASLAQEHHLLLACCCPLSLPFLHACLDFALNLPAWQQSASAHLVSEQLLKCGPFELLLVQIEVFELLLVQIELFELLLVKNLVSEHLMRD